MDKENKKRSKAGENNSFYGKKHSEESKRKMGGAVVDYSGEKNPFYGKKHSQESIDSMKDKLSEIFSGESNPFFGKTHTDEAKEKIKNKQLEYRANNKEKILQRQLLRLNLTVEKLHQIFQEYSTTSKNADDLQAEYNIDKRVIFKYIEQLGVATKEEIDKIKLAKRLHNSKSSPEDKLFKMLSDKYGEKNVIKSHKIKSYIYDIFLFKSLLVEYDGYYWHTVIGSPNDAKKDALAKSLNIEIYRVKENEKRYVDFDAELIKIDEVLDEIRARKNNKKRNP